jgi:PAS domain S-box-containing protein
MTPLDRPRAATDPERAPGLLSDLLHVLRHQSVLATDLDETIVMWGEGAARAFGYVPHEVVGRMKCSQLCQSEDDRLRLRHAMEVARTTGRWSGMLAGAGRHGPLTPAEVVIAPWHDDQGAVAGFLLVSADISRSDATFRALVESAPDAMVIVDAKGAIVLLNSQTEQLFGYAREELLGQPVEMLLPVRFRRNHPDHRAAFAAEPRVRGMGASVDFYGLRKNGEEVPVEISLSPIETEDGTLVSASIRDASDRRRFERALREKNAELEEANRAKNTFLASMSHELRTPLNAIIGFTGTLLMRLPGPLTEDQEHQLQTVRTSARHLLSLINDLLDLARIESGRAQIDPKPLVCQTVLKEVVTSLRPLAEAKGLALELGMPEADVIIETDRRALSQILINLTNNAIKFTDRGAVRLELGLAGNDERSLEIRIIDTGVGIKAEDQTKVFSAFTPLGGGGAGPESTGLGLHLSQKLAALLGGGIAFTSQFGTGSTFVVTLPARARS